MNFDLAYLQLSSLFELLSVTLTLPSRTGGQEHIFGVAVDIFFPVREPSHRVVMLNLKRGNSGREKTPHARRHTLFQLPSILGVGTAASAPMLITISSGLSRYYSIYISRLSRRCRCRSLTLNRPFLGCSPRPLNSPGGSTRKFPTFSFLPSIVAKR